MKTSNRPNWEEYFLKFAELASTRSVCERSKCGAVIVKDNRIIATGYNGAPSGQPNCADIGWCYRNENSIKSGTSPELCRAAGCHSENNAIANAARHNGGCQGATMYVYGNTSICTQCKGQIANAGITNVVYRTKEGKVEHVNVPRDWKIHPIDQGPGKVRQNA